MCCYYHYYYYYYYYYYFNHIYNYHYHHHYNYHYLYHYVTIHPLITLSCKQFSLTEASPFPPFHSLVVAGLVGSDPLGIILYMGLRRPIPDAILHPFPLLYVARLLNLSLCLSYSVTF